MSAHNAEGCHHSSIKNVVIFEEEDLLPDMGMYEDTGYVINDLYGSKSREVDKIRAYAVGMVRAYFNVSKEDAQAHFEIVIVPFVDIYNDNGRILARRI